LPLLFIFRNIQKTGSSLSKKAKSSTDGQGRSPNAMGVGQGISPARTAGILRQFWRATRAGNRKLDNSLKNAI
jgi:hypothetical protein